MLSTSLTTRNNFEILDNNTPLGEGGFSVVFKGRDTFTNTSVAIKVYKPGAQPLDDMRHALHEADVLRCVVHPNVVKFIARSAVMLEGDIRHCICTELVEGTDMLVRMTKHGGFTSAQKQMAFAQVVDAVRHCHSCKVAHRDIKLENLIVTPSGNVKLIDFGLASTNMASVSDAAGSLPYVAPEAVMPDKCRSFDPIRADCWSVGVLLFMLGYGCQPIKSPHTEDPVIQRLIQGSAPASVVITDYWRIPLARDLRSNLIIDALIKYSPKTRASMQQVHTWLSESGGETRPTMPTSQCA